jgi:uncharacterized protein YjbI with pentapeptide repeats
MDKAKLDKVVADHGKWLRGDEGGVRANLRGADLSRANLSSADLCSANLRWATIATGWQLVKA